MSRRALFIAYAYPPIAAAGAQRSAKLVKYLTRLGWQITVVAARSSPYFPTDHSLLRSMPATPTHRTRWNVLPNVAAHGRIASWRRLVWPDTDLDVGWLPLLRLQVRRLMRETRFDVVYTSCSPFWVNLEGMRIRRKLGTPWVTDFRDPWISNTLYRPASKWLSHLHHRVERRTAEACDGYVANTRRNLEVEIRKYPVLRGKATAISNGYDPEDFEGPRVPPSNGLWNLTYTGSVYDSYNPTTLFGYLRAWLATRPQARVAIHYAGPSGASFLRYAREAGLESLVRDHGPLSHPESIRRMRSSDLLLLFLPDAASASGWIPAKLYEYIATGTPIFAALPDGEAGEVMDRAGAGLRMRPNQDPRSAVKILDALATAHREKRPPCRPDRAFIKTFEWPRLAEELAAVFARVSGVRS